MEQFKKVLLHKNEGVYNSELSKFNSIAAFLQKYVDDYNRLKLTPLDENDLPELIQNPQAFIINKITGGQSMSIGNVPLNPAKVFELLDKPAGTEELIKQIDDNTNVYSTNEYYHWPASQFAIKDGKTVELNPEELTALDYRCSTFIETEEQANAYKVLSDTAESLNTLIGKKIDEEYLFENLFDINRDGKITVKPKAVQFF